MIESSRQHHVNFVEQKSYENVPFNDEEKDLLISSGVMYQTKDDSFVFQVVGAAVIGRRVIYVVPKFESEADQSAKVGVFYVQVIKQYLLAGSRRSSIVPTLDNVPLIMRTFEELNSYYVEFGVYKERKHIHISSEARQTNWPKTIIKNQALFSNIPDFPTPLQSVLYAEPMITTHNSYEGEVSHLFRSILTLLSTFIAPIMRMRHPLESKASIDRIVDSVNGIFNKSVYYKRILRAHISAEAGPRKRLLKVMYNFLSSDNDELARIFGKRIFVFGTQNFELVWEDACLGAVGAQRGSQDLAQPRVSSNSVRINSQRTDGIIYPNNKINKVTIIDAKYYVSHKGEPISLPVGDIMKQFGYAVSARATWPRYMIQNYIVMPHFADSEEKVSVLGVVNLEKDGALVNDFDPIVLLKVKPSEVLSFYVKRSVNHWLKDIISEKEDLLATSASPKIFKAKLGGFESKIEISSKGVVTLKAGSIFKSGQSSYNRKPTRGKSIDSNWPKAKIFIKSLFANGLVKKESGAFYLLKSDIDCSSLEVATLVISGMDPSASPDVWKEHGFDA